MGKSIAVFDLDKTIYNEHSFFGSTKYIVDAGILPSEAWDKLTEELSKYRKKLQTYAVTANNLLAIYAQALTGREYGLVLVKTREFFEKNMQNFYGYFGQILPELKKTHAVYLVTTNSQMVAEVVVKLFGLDGYLCSKFEVADGVFTGKVKNTLADGKQSVQKLLDKFGGETMGVGDSENDIEMLARVKHPLCFQPSEELRVEAGKRGWRVVDEKNAAKTIIDLVYSFGR